MDLLKQFSKADLMEVIRHIVGDEIDPIFTRKILDDLHVCKYKRLIESHNKNVDKYNKRYKKYVNKRMPRELQKEFNLFAKSFQKTEGDTREQHKIMISLGLIKKDT